MTKRRFFTAYITHDRCRQITRSGNAGWMIRLLFITLLYRTAMAVAPELPADSIRSTDSATIPLSIDTIPITSDSTAKKIITPLRKDSLLNAIGSKKSQSFAPPDTSKIDTLSVADGSYFSAGFGWSLGDFTLLSLWEKALPDSLGSFGFTTTSFNVPYDSSAGAEQSIDTALLSFSVKEKPAAYTMSFPLSFSLIRIRENDRFSLSLHGSWMRKIFTATIAAVGDTLARKADYRESMNIVSAFFSAGYSRLIPTEYFSIQGVARSHFTAAFEFAPMIACMIRRTITVPAADERFGKLQKEMSSPSRRLLHGRAATVRLGLNLLRRLNSEYATDFGISYCIQGYGYFREKGARTTFIDIDPANSKKGHPLYWISNRFEISFAFMRLHRKKQHRP